MEALRGLKLGILEARTSLYILEKTECKYINLNRRYSHLSTIGGNANLCRMYIYFLLCSDSDMDCHINTYVGLLERCGSTELSNTNCVKVACILVELYH